MVDRLSPFTILQLECKSLASGARGNKQKLAAPPLKKKLYNWVISISVFSVYDVGCKRNC
eukprot:m.50517 g.50517  ORF g.50517 m.50517 type:complete len:60 (-) comp15376_c0_seq2:191-370(-)